MKKIKYLYKQLCMLVFYILNRKEILKTISENKEIIERLEFFKIKNKAIQYKMIIQINEIIEDFKTMNINDAIKAMIKTK